MNTLLERDPKLVYIAMSGCLAFLGSGIWVLGTVYYFLQVHMSPFQLVFVGTVLEVSYLIFQVPTGVWADMHGRKRSVVIGLAAAGLCWTAEGLIPLFVAIVAAEAVRGAGEAFFDGAESAWLADEVGPEAFGQVVLRATQASQIGGLLGLPAGALLAQLRLNLPIVVGGLLMVGLSAGLIWAMRETTFRRDQPAGERGKSSFQTILLEGLKTVRGQPVLLTILAVELFWGLSSEGFDRLWEAHLVRNLSLPAIGAFKPIIWFGLIGIGRCLAVLATAQVFRRYLSKLLSRRRATSFALSMLSAIQVVATVAFALSGRLDLAIASLVVRWVAVSLAVMIDTVWLNQNVVNSEVRATVHSLQGGINAGGQIMGGPAVGLVGNARGLRAAIAVAGLALAPATALYGWFSTRRQALPGSALTGPACAGEE